MSSTASEIDDLVGFPTVVDADPYKDIDIEALTEDLAREIFTPDEILPRYGLTKDTAKPLLRRPEVWRKYEAKRQHWRSDANAAERLKAYYQAGLIEAAPDLLAGLRDEKIPYKERIEAHKFVAKIAGLEPAPNAGGAGVSGPQFAVNILFSGGATQTITATVAPPVDTSTGIQVDAEAAE